MKILILASNPRKDLNLDREIRDLKDVIKKSHNRQQFEVEDALAVRVGDLQELFFRHRPQIVHFCGHGSGEQGLVFEGNDGGEQWVRAAALSDLFRLFSENVGCVLLNACYSEEQASAIVDHIDYVIGMNQEIRDDAAIAFSKGFYRALGYARSIEEAYEFGKNAIQLEISGSSKVLRSATEQQRKLEVVDSATKQEIPEHLKPILKRNPRLSQNTNRVISGSQQPLSHAQREEIQLNVVEALAEKVPDQEDANLQQYREKVRECLADRSLTPKDKFELKQLAERLSVSEQLQIEILQQEQNKIEIAKEDYKKLISDYVKEGYYPFNEQTQGELKELQYSLGLLDFEVAAISQPTLETAEQERLEKLRQRYEQEFRKAIEAQYPIASFVRDELRKFQQTLGLSDEEVARIEEPIAASKELAYQQQVARQQELERQKEREREVERERQRQLEEERKREEAKKTPPLKEFEFQVATVNIGSRTIEKPGFLGKKTETITTVNITHHRGQAEYFVEEFGDGVTLEMVAIVGGTFMMGSTEYSSEQPQHQVTVQPFFMGKFTVTQAQWRAIARLPKVSQDLDSDPARFKGDNRPVEQVNWYEAVEFCDRLSKKTGRKYRLPSEVEWEYACRAGSATPFYCGETIATDLANYNGNYTYGSGTKGVYRQQTTDVGSFSPNAFGLYDMHGNVWEWCADHWHENYENAPKDGSAWVTGGDSNGRLLRGGSWNGSPRYCRSACRLRNGPDYRHLNIGFRVVYSAAWTL